MFVCNIRDGFTEQRKFGAWDKKARVLTMGHCCSIFIFYFYVFFIDEEGSCGLLFSHVQTLFSEIIYYKEKNIKQYWIYVLP